MSESSNASPLKQTGNRINLIGIIVGAFLLLIPFPYAAIIGAVIIFVCGTLLIWHLKWVEDYRPRGGLLIFLLALICAVLGHLARPTAMPTASELAKEIAKELPVALPQATPSLTILLAQARAQYNPRLGLTEVLLQAEIRNNGAPSSVTEWEIYYHSPTLEKELRFVKPLHSPLLFPDPVHQDVALEFDYPRDSINEKVKDVPVTKEVPVRGRILLNVPGNRSDEIGRGVARIYVSIYDYLGRRSDAMFIAGGGPPYAGTLLPGETIRRLTESEKSRVQ